jgi:hypothetical protein
MSNHKASQYIKYTEYYIITSAYQIINVVNELLTFSASCSDNFKGYLHSKVVSKEVQLNELSRQCRQSIYENDNNNKKNGNGNDDDIDEDGFVVIKMRKPRTKVIKPTNENQRENIGVGVRTENEINTVNLSDACVNLVIKEIMEELINSVTTKNEIIMNAL